MTDDPFEIPEFLRRHVGEVLPPWKPLDVLPSRKEPDEPTAPVVDTAAARAEADRIKKDNALKKMRDRAAIKAAVADPDMVWRNGRFVHHQSMTRGKYEYVLNNLPTPSMKRLFVHLYSERVL